MLRNSRKYQMDRIMYETAEKLPNDITAVIIRQAVLC